MNPQDSGNKPQGNIGANPTMASQMDISPLPQFQGQKTAQPAQPQQPQVATPPVPPPVEPKSQSTDQTQFTVPGRGGGGGGFKIFVIFSIVIIAIIYSAVYYLYTQNQKMKSTGTTNNQDLSSNLATPTPEFTPDQIKIKNGSVVREKPGGEISVVVDKETYESTGITGFAKVVVSPDANLICFESWPPAPEPALYLSDVDGGNVVEVSPNRQNCLWSADSKKVIYVNSSSKTTPQNIYIYDIGKKEETNLTVKSVPQGAVRRYQVVGLTADESKIICTYEEVGKVTPTEGAQNRCEIDLSSYAITF